MYEYARSLLSILILVMFMNFYGSITTAYSQPTFAPLRRVYESFEDGLGIFRAEPSGTTGVKITHLYKHSGSSSLLVNVTRDFAYAITDFQGMNTYFRIEFFVCPISRYSTGNLPIASILLFSESTTTISMWLNDSGLVVIADGLDYTKNISPVVFNEWIAISLAYDPHKGEYDVNVGSSTVAIIPLSRPPDSGVKVLLGVFDLSGSQGGSLAYDEISLYLSPLILVDPPLANVEDTIEISGLYFTPRGQVYLEVISEVGFVKSWDDIIADDAGNFSVSLKLENIHIGLFNVIATDLSSGSKVVYHFGIWGRSTDEVRKVRPFYVSGAGLMPNSQAKINLISKGLKLQEIVILVDENGKFISPAISIPASAPLGVYEITIEGTSTYDFKSRGFEDGMEFTLKGAIIDVKIETDSGVYGRLQELKVAATGMYENGSLVPYNPNVALFLTLKNDTHNILLKRSMGYDILVKTWTYVYILPENLSLGNYMIDVEFRDPYGNIGKAGSSILIREGYLKVKLSGIEKERSYERSVTLNISAVVLYTEERSVKSGRFYAIFISPHKDTKTLELKYNNLTKSWNGSFVIGKNETLGRFTLVINGMDDYGNIANYSTWFFVKSAKLRLTPDNPIPPEIQRTQPFDLRFYVKYSSGESINEDGTASILLLKYYGNASFEWKLSPVKNTTSGELVWTTSDLKLPANAPLGQYFGNVTVFDEYGNMGIFNFNLSLILANLKLNFSASKSNFQVGFEQVLISGKIFYQDGTELSEGCNISTTVKVNSYLKSLTSSYERNKGWVMILTTTPLDPSGYYIVYIRAEDIYGNAGETYLELAGSQLFVIISIILIVASVGTVLAMLLRNIRRSRKAVKQQQEYQVFG